MIVNVEPTVVGFFLVPTIVLVAVFKPKVILPLTFLLAFLQGISVANIYFLGFGHGLRPAYLSAFLFVATFWFVFSVDWSDIIPQELLRCHIPLFIFAVCAALSSIVIPYLFQGSVMVYPPRAGYEPSAQTPLRFFGSNLTQSIYIVFLACLSLLASLALAMDERIRRLALRCMVIGALLAISFGFYEFIAWLCGIPTPDFLFESAKLYAGPSRPHVLWHSPYVLGKPLLRLQSTFFEPSYFGYFLSGIFGFCCSHVFLSEKPGWGSVALLVLTTAAILMSISTTAYGAILIVGLIILVKALLNNKTRPRATAGSLLIVGVCATALFGLWYSGHLGILTMVLWETSLGKVWNLSGTARLAADTHSAGLLFQTYGLGVGWGSNRCSSLVAQLASNSGVWGLALLSVFAWRVMQLFRKGLAACTSESQRRFIGSCGYMVLAYLIAGSIGVPDTVYIFSWCSLWLLLGYSAAALRDAPT